MTKTKVFAPAKHAEYREQLPLLRASGGDAGGAAKDW